LFTGSGALPLVAAPPSNIADLEVCCRKVEGSWRISSLQAKPIFAAPHAVTARV
jgi:hypothetical protein